MKTLAAIAFASLLLALAGCTNAPFHGQAGGSTNMYESGTPRP